MNDFQSKNLGEALSFNDVLLVPQYSEITSRLNVSLETQLVKSDTVDIKIKNPVIPTNMSTITEFKMMKTLFDLEGTAFCHRFFKDYHDIHKIITLAKENKIYPISISIGTKDQDRNFVKECFDNYQIPDIFLIDIAHGDSKSVVEMINYVRSYSDKIAIIGGNVATGDGYERLVNAGADAVRVGISGGSVCTTRYETGHGVPTLSSVMGCYKTKMNFNYQPPIIADGGINSSGDIVKALAFGADAVCVGRMLSGSSDTPGDVINTPEGCFKEYYGMSSKTAQDRFKDGLRRGIAAEGIEKLVDYTGDTSEILLNILGGVRSGLSYAGAENIVNLRNNFKFITLCAASITNKNNNWNQ